ncbi:glycosyltransferase family 25 protein [Roseiconus lacunae]|uniref:glycosyltransferase family 25 protein n=1 Tax=Roseiconus lacunae TaxID=2605694 RepID=UPI00308A6539|nr:glycosyltransferase family 25 protein [Stieleria sp. HD01]
MKMEIERAVVINLDRDSQRLEQFYQALPADWPFPKPERFSAFEGSRLPCPPWWVAGDAAWGCFRSHQCVIEQAIGDGIQSLLVMEDDAFCHAEFSTLFKTFERELPIDWQWVYLGGQHIQREQGLPIRISEHVYRPFNAHRSHAYAFSGATAMQMVAAHLYDRDAWGEKHHVDHRFGELHAEFDGGLYCPDRWLIGQEAGFSNIKQKHLDANFFPDARSFYDLRIDHPVVAVVGSTHHRRMIIAAILHRLGISFGTARPPESIADAPDSYCAPGFDSVCNHLVTGQGWHLANDREFRIAHLRMWADRRLKAAKNVTPIGATQRKLALLHQDVQAAWPETTFIAVAGDDERIGIEAVHDRQVESAINELASEAEVHRIERVDFDDPEQLVQRLVALVDWKFKPADVATAKQMAISLCRSV